MIVFEIRKYNFISVKDNAQFFNCKNEYGPAIYSNQLTTVTFLKKLLTHGYLVKSLQKQTIKRAGTSGSYGGKCW